MLCVIAGPVETGSSKRVLQSWGLSRNLGGAALAAALAIGFIPPTWAAPSAFGFKCVNWTGPRAGEIFRGTLIPGASGPAGISIEYSVPVAGKNPYVIHSSADMEVDPDRSTNAQTQSWNYIAPSGSIRGRERSTLSLEKFIETLGKESAQVQETRVHIVLPALLSGKPGPTPASHSVLSFRLMRNDGKYLDLLTVWKCSLDGEPTP